LTDEAQIGVGDASERGKVIHRIGDLIEGTRTSWPCSRRSTTAKPLTIAKRRTSPWPPTCSLYVGLGDQDRGNTPDLGQHLARI